MNIRNGRQSDYNTEKHMSTDVYVIQFYIIAQTHCNDITRYREILVSLESIRNGIYQPNADSDSNLNGVRKCEVQCFVSSSKSSLNTRR